MSEIPVAGVVLQGTGGQWHVRTSDGRTVVAALRGRVKHVTAKKLAVGDQVELLPDPAGTLWVIHAIRPRRSELSRRSPGGAHGERILAVNVDQVIVVLAMVKPEPNEGLLDRFLVIAEANDLSARIVINKTDLASAAQARERFADYARAGYPVHCTSTKTGEGMEELRATLRSKVSTLAGPSGTGKSSLLNHLYPGLELRVGAISESVNKGRHTTVGSLMHPLPDGGYIVDTPGLREVGLWGLSAASLDQCFPEFAPSLGRCRFADCRHLSEPDCAVLENITAGGISRRRYDSYAQLYEEARAAERDM